MSDPDESTPTDWDDLAEVGKYPTLREAQEHGLVVLAMREPCWVSDDHSSEGYTLHTEPQAAPAIRRELSEYDLEQSLPPPSPAANQETFAHPAGWSIYAAWALILISVYRLQQTVPWLDERACSSSTGLIGNHEWWRPFTALFLHADPSHLVGNLASGMLFGTLVARSIGPLRGWALILLSGTLGNAITSALTWPESFTSIGASTAVFGALGILSGLGFTFMLRHRFRIPWLRVAAPVLAGIVILGWFGGGTPGGNTDVLGHVFGFISGLAAGIAVGQLSPRSGAALIAANHQSANTA